MSPASVGFLRGRRQRAPDRTKRYLTSLSRGRPRCLTSFGCPIVLDEITIAARGASELVDVTLHWAGAAPSAVSYAPDPGLREPELLPLLEARVLELGAVGRHPESIAARLNRDGFESARVRTHPLSRRRADPVPQWTRHPPPARSPARRPGRGPRRARVVPATARCTARVHHHYRAQTATRGTRRGPPGDQPPAPLDNPRPAREGQRAARPARENARPANPRSPSLRR